MKQQNELSESEIIKLLDKLDKGWNKNYWLFSANGTLNLMKYNEDGDRAIENDGTTMSRDAIVKVWHNVINDGGDW